MNRFPLTIAAIALTGLLAACGAAEPFSPGSAAAGGTCLVGAADCDDTGPTPSDAARALLGLTEDELSDDVRIARDGDEQYALTEDYAIGRFTVELDDGRVTVVTLESEDGPVTVTG